MLCKELSRKYLTFYRVYYNILKDCQVQCADVAQARTLLEKTGNVIVI